MRGSHVVNGTLFSFPELPPKEDVPPALYARFTRERQAILDKAAACKFKPAPKQKAWKGPRPGNGEFSPAAGKPGSLLEVDGLVFEVWADAPRWGGHKAVWATCEGRYYVLNNIGSYTEVTAQGLPCSARKEADG